MQLQALDRKLLRDLWRLKGQSLAIAAVIMAAVATVMMSLGTRHSLLLTRDDYYRQAHFADVFANVKRAPEQLVRRISEIEGVQATESRVVQYGLADMPQTAEPVRLGLYSIPETHPGLTNTVLIRTGRSVEAGNADEIVLHEAFATANDLHPGDSITATIYGKQRHLQIVGIGLAPDFIYVLGPGDLVPDDRRFGIGWMGREALEAAANMKEAFNAISITLRHDASEQDVITALDRLLNPYGGTGAYGRKTQLSNAFIESELDQLGAMTKTIPPVFLLVSTFLVYLVLNRLIQAEREQIGLLKAFGYTSKRIMFHYLKLTALVASLGIIGGWAAGAWLGHAMTGLYASYYRFPAFTYQLSASTFILSAVLSFVFSSIGAVLGTRQALVLAPAVAMSPPPPAVYGQSRLERLFAGKGVGAVGQMIVRHLLRWPVRSLMTTTGVGMSLALLFSVMQFHDAADRMLDLFFGRSQQEDIAVHLTEARALSVVSDFMHLPGVLKAEPERVLAARLRVGALEERQALESVTEGSTLAMRVDSNGRRIPLPPGGLILTTALANKLNASVGDTVQIELLQGKRLSTEVKVTRVIEEFIGTRAYMDFASLNTLAGEGPVSDRLLLKVDTSRYDELYASLKKLPMISSVSRRDTAVNEFRRLMDQNIFTMIFFYSVFAGIIVIGVVYNNARIILAERQSEFATLRVLGYRNSEIAIILVGELATLIFLALPLGCLLGNLLARLITAMFSSDLFRLPFAPLNRTYGEAMLVILAASMVTAVAVARRTRHLDLIAVLKARD